MSKFYIIGNNISHSLSPTIHNAAFEKYDLPYHYSIFQTPSVDESVRHLIHQQDFGGASVTFPHKLAIGSLLASETEAARLIGAVNTVIVDREDGREILRGDNTDWIGIMNVLRKLGTTVSQSSIVIGAGGAARAAVFALQSLGIQDVVIVNRTEATARSIQSMFPSLNIQIFKKLGEAPAANIIIGCIPADDIVEDDIPQHIFGEKGSVIEMSYRPPVSALMKVAYRQQGWQVADGVDILKEQAYAQFELWTGKQAPIDVIEEALKRKINSGTKI